MSLSLAKYRGWVGSSRIARINMEDAMGEKELLADF